MGIVNTTPDSFSDGGRFLERQAAVDHALRLLDEGADVIDIGGESTRPGAPEVDARTERDRVVPVIREVKRLRPECRISVDTRKAAVAVAALEAGAAIVNDVSGLEDPDMAGVCAAANATVIVMHTRGTPLTMQLNTEWDDLVGEVEIWLTQRTHQALAAGVSRANVWIDPGLGFAKKTDANTQMIAAIPRLNRLGFPVVVGASRKRFIGELTGQKNAAERVFGSIGAALAAAANGAAWLRVHDVAATRDALAVFCAVSNV